MAEFQKYWPGDVTLVIEASPTDSSGNLGVEWLHPDELSFNVRSGQDRFTTVAGSLPDVLLASLTLNHHSLLGIAKASVLTAENPARERIRFATSSGTMLDRARVEVGTWRREPRLIGMARAANGLQCNGVPAFRTYGRWNKSALLFFDSRLSAQQLSRAREARAGRPERTALRLGFSGRLHPAKGPDAALRAFLSLGNSSRVESMTVIGAGVMETELRQAALGQNVRFPGDLPFDPEWIDLVTNHIDLMLLPHRQGDPSGTYLETAGCGAPILGYGNAALTSLVDIANLGWTVQMNDELALMRRVLELADSPQELQRASQAGLDFMAEHSFGDEYERRVDHLLECYKGRVRA
jgi:colanic acid/amylovoran biosynthesis glycosyltransferase